ncbi:TPA: hypothetical protein I7142_12665 [Vibrio vulnificus]|uniref:hypothetical protein n=1 Tax=Vibrio vulnificus TaxID=672 RepID=UPI000695F757|nr:hypothetical protein [Vibrio vulnificus]EGQ8085931.1 hypothetical protein [Vibrio vulnificus]HAS6024609.1 hypothetical protein [Vibrio vulnificus]HAS6034702.1 hypothetical protein [Vibrio vulnificus]
MIKVKGFDKIHNRLNNIKNGLQKLSDQKQVPISDLFTSDFMKAECPSFASIDDLLTLGGFQFSTKEEFEAIEKESLDQFIATNTRFDNWDDLIAEAGKLYIKRNLEL